MPSTKVDDRDPSVKLSNDNWGKLSDPAYFEGTVTFNRIPGSSLTITFTGISISVFGSIQYNTTPTSTYAIDNGLPALFSLEEEHPLTEFDQKFFQSNELSPGNHELLVTNTGDWFFLDYYILETSSSSSEATTATQTLSPISAPSDSSGPPNQTLSSSVASSTNSTARNSLSAAAIVGIIAIAVIAAVTTLVVLYCFYRKRKARDGRRKRSEVPAPFDGQQAAHPQSRLRKNKIHSTERFVPIETRQQQAISFGTLFGEIENVDVEGSRAVSQAKQSSRVESESDHHHPPAYDQLSSTQIPF